MDDGGNRVVVLVDMDCFYCQVEEQLKPELRGRPLAVVQYNQWQGGGIIAVNYLARAKGVTRHMRGDEAKKQCPELELASVPSSRGKADVSRYREAGKKVALVLQEFTPLLERASVDEAYLDITESVNSRIKDYMHSKSISKKKLPNTYVLGYPDIDDYLHDVYENNIELELTEFDKDHSMKLLVGAVIVSEMRAAVYEKTGYECSAGVAHNKIMAKLVCGMNKPNKQTILPKNRISEIFESLPINKIKSLGGKFGETVCNILKISTMKELLNFSESDLKKYFDEKNGLWLYKIARGIDNEPVTPRFSSKSIGCCKKFPGKNAIQDLHTLKHWLGELGSEIEERLTIDFTENNRHPTQMVVSFTKELNKKDISCSRSINMTKDDITCAEMLSKSAFEQIKKENSIINTDNVENEDNVTTKSLINPIKFLGISVGKFESGDKNSKGIKHFFNKNVNNALAKKVEQPKDDDKIEQTNIPTIDFNTPSGTSHNKDNLPPFSKNSFIMKYLKNFKPQLDIIHNDNSSDSIAEYINDNSNSNISENSIDFEINKVKNVETKVENNSENPDRCNSFSISKFFNNESEDTTASADDSNTNDVKTNTISRTYCEECNKYIYETNISTHNDYHFAKTIREEDRKNSGNKTSIIAKPKSTMQTKTKTNVKNNSNVLTFFNKINDSNNDKPPESDVPYETCHECGKNVPLTNFPEHADYHEALRLQKTLNKPHSPAVTVNTINSNKRKAKMSSDKRPKNQCSISSFFKNR